MAHSAASGVGFGAGGSSASVDVIVTEDDLSRLRSWKRYHPCSFLGFLGSSFWNHSIDARFWARIVTYPRKMSVLQMIEIAASKMDIESA